MLSAFYVNTLIHLHSINRENLQKIYEDGKKGLLACPACGEAVRLYLGIKDIPHFYHYSKKVDCKEDAATLSSETAAAIEYEERNGFRIPKSRAIINESARTEYKKTKQLTVQANFQPTAAKPSFKENYLHKLFKSGIALDSSQADAVSLDAGHALVIAGAGSGKTRVLTARAAYLIHEKHAEPSSVMLVTFTNKAAAELKERLLKYPNMSRSVVNKIVTGTFHRILYQILLFHQPDKWPRQNLISKDWQKEALLKEGAHQLKLDTKEFPYDGAIQQIGAWKNSMLFPNNITASSDWEEAILLLYKWYEEKKHERNLYDFDDMLLGGYYYFLENPSILEIYQNRFRHILLDEFQDINKVQYEWVKLIAAKAESIYAVGDDDQSIYAFRGSDPKYLLDFEKDFENAKIIILDHNYRSAHEIVATANAVVSKNKKRRTKKMIAAFTGEAPFLFYPYDEEEEATMIVTDMLEKISQGYKPKDFAILYRTNTSSRAIFERLTSSSLPFKLEADSGSFYSRFIVKSMLGYLKLIIHPDHGEAIKDVFPSLFLKKSILQDIKAASILEDCTLLEAVAKVKTGFAFQEAKLKKIPAVLASLKQKQAVDAISVIEKELGFQEFIKKRGNEGNQWDKGSDDIRDLKVVAKRFASIIDFIGHTDHMTAMNAEMKKQYMHTDNTITLSTIHRAKGLEYKTVYILGAVDGSIPHDYALEAQRNNDTFPLEEERRLLYVAMTRAQKELFVSVPMQNKGKKAKISRFLNFL
ncbi:UvrD-helicase domain-containing protein [Niallia sp. NCCP-28]|uniref:UvrD-helicase domain-containing protein n=1 Tax=Niallia sp. NCCP-28 TaxID=2934712 RepID=UPI0020807477|nr:ATP-dependent helicase [Niallia sp. NCCP-28]GKU81829.1 putative ATP-dependent DNA helicase YjcD [Niallia sp. NCCP-28]